MAVISKLATSQYLTDKHWEWRDGTTLKYIIPHHMAGIMTGAECAKYFVNNGLENSANYCIGNGGDISCNVPEEYGAWTSSFQLADRFGITIEVSNSSRTSSDWPVSDAAIEALIKLMVDLIQRYPSLGGKAQFYATDEYEVVAARKAYRAINCKGNILLHNWTDLGRKNCPGPYMTRNMPAICAEVNKRLAGGGGTTRTLRGEAQYMITNNVNGTARQAQARHDGFEPEEVQAEIDRMLGKDLEANAAAVAKIMRPVHLGDTTDAVYVLQVLLDTMGYYGGDIDGQFGDQTQAALIAYQWNIKKVYGGLEDDGICGETTWLRMLTGK